MARCLSDMGLRASEVAAIQLDDLNWRDGTLTIGRGKSRRADVLPLLKATDNLLPVGGLRPLTYRTLFGLLAAAGLRISEALHLKPQDVDLEHELLTVRQTKFRKSRLVPLDSTVVAARARYAGARHRKLSGQKVDAFFVSDRGKPLPTA